jgi:hypothetical protein
MMQYKFPYLNFLRKENDINNEFSRFIFIIVDKFFSIISLLLSMNWLIYLLLIIIYYYYFILY